MLHLLLLLPLVFGQNAYEKQGDIVPKKGTKVAMLNLGSCWEAEFDIVVKGTRGPWCSLMHLGNSNGNRKLGLWLYPGKTRLHTRTRTTRSTNPGLDPGFATFALNKKYNVRINVCGKSLTVSVGSKTQTVNLGAPLYDNKKPEPLYIGNPWYQGCNAVMSKIEVFSSLPPVYADCSKLKSLYNAKKSKLAGERDAASKAIPVHQAAQKAHSSNLSGIGKVRTLANSLKSMSRRTVDKLIALLNKLKREASAGLSKAKKGESDARGNKARAEQHLKQLDVNNVSCQCAAAKAAHEKKINEKSTESVDIKKNQAAIDKMIALLNKQIAFLNMQAKQVPSQPGWLAGMMKAMFTDQINRVKATQAALAAKKKGLDAKLKANEAYISKYRKLISDCDAKLKAMRSKLMELFTADDQDLIDMIEGMEYFEELKAAEVWSHNLNIDVYEQEFDTELFGEEEAEEDFAARQEVEGVEATQISLGLIGGAGFLSSGLFYWAYQHKQSS